MRVYHSQTESNIVPLDLCRKMLKVSLIQCFYLFHLNHHPPLAACHLFGKVTLCGDLQLQSLKLQLLQTLEAREVSGRVELPTLGDRFFKFQRFFFVSIGWR